MPQVGGALAVECRREVDASPISSAASSSRPRAMSGSTVLLDEDRREGAPASPIDAHDPQPPAGGRLGLVVAAETGQLVGQVGERARHHQLLLVGLGPAEGLTRDRQALVDLTGVDEQRAEGDEGGELDLGDVQTARAMSTACWHASIAWTCSPRSMRVDTERVEGARA